MPELIFLTSFVCMGLFITGQQGYILFPLRNFIARKLGGVYLNHDGWYYEFNGVITEIWKPFWGCSVCMASVWGSVVYALFDTFDIQSIYELPVLILCSAALNFIIFNNMVKKHI